MIVTLDPIHTNNNLDWHLLSEGFSKIESHTVRVERIYINPQLLDALAELDTIEVTGLEDRMVMVHETRIFIWGAEVFKWNHDHILLCGDSDSSLIYQIEIHFKES